MGEVVVTTSLHVGSALFVDDITQRVSLGSSGDVLHQSMFVGLPCLRCEGV